MPNITTNHAITYTNCGVALVVSETLLCGIKQVDKGQISTVKR